jgi:hypothetical protein
MAAGDTTVGARFSKTFVYENHTKATGMACGIKALPFSQIVLDT